MNTNSHTIFTKEQHESTLLQKKNCTIERSLCLEQVPWPVPRNGLSEDKYAFNFDTLVLRMYLNFSPMFSHVTFTFCLQGGDF
jgi:hypothetical protein